MAVEEQNYYPITLRQGETRVLPFVYRPIDKTLDPYDLTNGVVRIRVQPAGAAEIVLGSPVIQITNAAGGEITIDLYELGVAVGAIRTAPYTVLLNGKRLFYGPLTVRSLYE